MCDSNKPTCDCAQVSGDERLDFGDIDGQTKRLAWASENVKNSWKATPKNHWKLEASSYDNYPKGSTALTLQARKSAGSTFYYGYQTNTEIGELKRVELAARTCYKSEDRITETSAIKLFLNLIKRGHYAMTRFGERTVFIKRNIWTELIMPILISSDYLQYWRRVSLSSIRGEADFICVSADLQSWIFLLKAVYKEMTLDAHHLFDEEHIRIVALIHDIFKEWLVMTTVMSYDRQQAYDLYMHGGGRIDAGIDVCNMWKEVSHSMLADDTLEPVRRHMFRVVCNRGISHEIVRHTTLSFAQESTRYVKYNREDPDAIKKVLFEPEHLRYHPAYKPDVIGSFPAMMGMCLETYDGWLNHADEDLRLNAGDARDFLPNSLKTEICISGYLDESPYGKEFNKGFSHFIDMRWDRHAHRGIQTIAREMAGYLGYPRHVASCYAGIEKD